VRASKHSLTAIILAAGEGTRMKSRTPKVLQRLGGRSILDWVLATAEAAGVDLRVVVLGHAAESVVNTLPKTVKTAFQPKQLGTGHAVQMAQKTLSNISGDVLVLCGDAPLIRPQTLRCLVKEHRRMKAKATVLTAHVPEAHGYGRIIRDPNDARFVTRIVEERDATPAERRIREVNSGAYCFSLPTLWEILGQIKNQNKKKEYYLTDVVALLRKEGGSVAAVSVPDASEILGVNTRKDLAMAAAVLNQRKLNALMDGGVTIWDPTRVWVDPEVRVGQDTELFPGTILTGRTVVGRQNQIGPDAYLDSTRTGSNVCIRYSVLEHARLGDHVTVGPYSHLRHGTRVESHVHIGNFAETNRSWLKTGVKMGHVSYLGDTVVGKRVNIGAGTITANYDGINKHPTRIGDHAFIGSGTVLIAPCQIGRKALTGAGAVVKPGTHVPSETVVVGVPARIIKRRK